MNKIFRNIILLGLLFLSVSCEDFLTRVDPNRLVTENFWSNYKESKASVIAAYAPLTHQALFGRFYYVYADGRSEDLYTTKSSGQEYDFCNFISTNWVSNNILSEMWQDCYVGIFRSNLILENVDKTQLTPDEDPMLIDYMKGEAYFLRGFYYYLLATNFRHFPLITVTPKNDADYYPKKEINRDLIWDRILEDYRAAIRMLPERWDDVSDLGRATKGAAYAHLGRALMFYYGYDKKSADKILVTEAKTAFEAIYGKYSLGKYFDNFLIETEWGPESVFEINFAEYSNITGYPLDDSKNGGQMRSQLRGIEFAPMNLVSGATLCGNWCNYQPTRVAFDRFKEGENDVEKSDPRFGVRDPRKDYTFHFWKTEYRDSIYGNDYAKLLRRDSVSNYGWRKYQMSSTKRSSERVNNLFPGLNIREFRYAEVLLYLAECEAIVGTPGRAVEYINEVRQRPGVDLVPLKKEDYQDVTVLMSQIMYERSVELLGEGRRWYDLLRWGKVKEVFDIYKNYPDEETVTVTDKNGKVFNVIKDYRPVKQKVNNYVEGKNDFYPIPQIELNRNYNLVQDPNY